MTPPTTPGVNGLPKVTLTAPDGATADIYLHGALVTSFAPSPGREVLALSSAAIWDGVAPIRGGVPICFPQFAAQGPLPMHGFARTSTWTLVEAAGARAVLSLADSPATRALWPHAFALTLTVTVSAAALTILLDVANPAGAPAPFDFEALLHTYLALGPGGAAAARVHGLRGETFFAKTPTGVEPARVEPEDGFALRGNVDRVFSPRAGAVDVTVRAGARAAVSVRAGAAARAGGAAPRFAPLDVVVWNPGAERARAIADLGAGDWESFVCVEPGRVAEATKAAGVLAPGDAWALTQVIAVGE